MILKLRKGNRFVVPLDNDFILFGKDSNFLYFFRWDQLYIGTPFSLSNVTTTSGDNYQQIYDQEDSFVLINFTSDGSVNRRGFRIQYYTGYHFIILSYDIINICLAPNWTLNICLLQNMLFFRGSVRWKSTSYHWKLHSWLHKISKLSKWLSDKCKLFLDDRNKKWNQNKTKCLGCVLRSTVKENSTKSFLNNVSLSIMFRQIWLMIS